MTTRSLAVIAIAAAMMSPVGMNGALAAESIDLPPEVTPALRAACERDVRRLCIGESPTFEKVKACVADKFLQLGRRCQVELASAGFSR